jgi:hypothetical protein
MFYIPLLVKLLSIVRIFFSIHLLAITGAEVDQLRAKQTAAPKYGGTYLTGLATLFRIAIATLALVFQLGHWSTATAQTTQGTIYGAFRGLENIPYGSFFQEFSSINPITGAYTSLVKTPYNGYNAIAFAQGSASDSVRNRFFWQEWGEFEMDYAVNVINTKTLVSSKIQLPVNSVFDWFEYDVLSGKLYGLFGSTASNAYRDLVSLDPDTGVITTLVSNVAYHRLHASAMDTAQRRIFFQSYSSSGVPMLRTYSLATNAVTAVPIIGQRFATIEYDPTSDRLITARYIDQSYPTGIFSVNAATGATIELARFARDLGVSYASYDTADPWYITSTYDSVNRQFYFTSCTIAPQSGGYPPCSLLDYPALSIYSVASGSLVTFPLQKSGHPFGMEYVRPFCDPVGSIQSLQSYLNQQIAAGTIPSGPGGGLNAKLNAAYAQMTNFVPPHTGPATNQINAFVNQVNALAGNGSISSAVAQALIAAANNIQSQIATCP